MMGACRSGSRRRFINSLQYLHSSEEPHVDLFVALDPVRVHVQGSEPVVTPITTYLPRQTRPISEKSSTPPTYFSSSSQQCFRGLKPTLKISTPKKKTKNRPNRLRTISQTESEPIADQTNANLASIISWF